MDNKKWYKRISTCFWFILATLPFTIPLIQFIGYHLTFNSGITSASDLITYHSDISGSYINIFNVFNAPTGTGNTIYVFSVSFIRDAFKGLFESLNFSSFNSNVLSSAFGWFVSVYFYEVIVDFVAWLPKLIHSFMQRWCAD